MLFQQGAGIDCLQSVPRTTQALNACRRPFCMTAHFSVADSPTLSHHQFLFSFLFSLGIDSILAFKNRSWHVCMSAVSAHAVHIAPLAKSLSYWISCVAIASLRFYFLLPTVPLSTHSGSRSIFPSHNRMLILISYWIRKPAFSSNKLASHNPGRKKHTGLALTCFYSAQPCIIVSNLLWRGANLCAQWLLSPGKKQCSGTVKLPLPLQRKARVLHTVLCSRNCFKKISTFTLCMSYVRHS